jgi:hypothetical protein
MRSKGNVQVDILLFTHCMYRILRTVGVKKHYLMTAGFSYASLNAKTIHTSRISMNSAYSSLVIGRLQG